MRIQLQAHETDRLPEGSCFSSISESSKFFEGGSVGYSVTKDCCRVDGMRLDTDSWKVGLLEVDHVESSFFGNKSIFPEGSIIFDHALIMRDLTHRWHVMEDIFTSPNNI